MMWIRGILKSNARAALFNTYWIALGACLLLGIISGFSLGLGVVALFVLGVLEVGKNRFFVHNRFGDTRFELLFSGFSNNYWNTFCSMLVTKVFIVLWSFLLVIPGIVKMYEYFFVPYVLADNPYIIGARAREISRILTSGEKFSIFIFQLSFIGWYLLGFLCFGIGILFVEPYYKAAEAELYICLRDRAIQSGMLNPAELGLFTQQAAM